MADEPQVRQERTGWRDRAMSQRHRKYGWHAPALDIDFLMLEYDTGEPQALVEYKAIGAKLPSFEDPSYRAMRKLADNSQIPFFVVFYDAQFWTYCVFAVNEYALDVLAYPRLMMCEQNYVEKLYTLRGRVPDKTLLKDLKTTLSDRMKTWIETLRKDAS